MDDMWRLVLHSSLVALVATGSFAPTLLNQFTFDDHLAITGNPDTRIGIVPWPELLHHDIWGKELHDPASHKSWRPLLVASFRLSQWRCHHEDTVHLPMCYRMENIIWHALASVLVYLLALNLVRSRYCLRTSAGGAPQAQDRRSSDTSWLPLVAALLFALHPVHVEAVAAVVNRAEPMSAVAQLLFITVYFSWRAPWFGMEESSASPLSLLGSRDAVYIACLGALYAFGALVKETAVLVAGVAIGLDTVFMWCNRKQRSVWISPPQAWQHTVVRWGALMLFAAMYFAARFVVMASPESPAVADITLHNSGLLRHTENPLLLLFRPETPQTIVPIPYPPPVPQVASLLWAKVLSVLYVDARYLRLLLFPKQLSCEYSFNCLPLILSLTDLRNVETLLAVSLCAVAVLYAFRSRDPVMASAIVAAMISFLPASHWLLRVGTLLAERLLYVPSIGVCIAAARVWEIAYYRHAQAMDVPPASPTLSTSASEPRSSRTVGSNTNMNKKKEMDKDADKDADTDTDTEKAPANSTSARASAPSIWHRLFWWLILGSVLFAFGVKIVVRGREWRNDDTLFTSALRVCPNSAKMNMLVGRMRLGQNDIVAAQHNFDKARSIDPAFCDVDYHYAFLHLKRHETEAAMRKLKSSLRCPFTNSRALSALESIWSTLLKDNPRNATLLEEIADAASVFNNASAASYLLHAMAVRLVEDDFAETLRLSDRAHGLHVSEPRPDGVQISGMERTHRCEVQLWRGTMLFAQLMAEACAQRGLSLPAVAAKWFPKLQNSARMEAQQKEAEERAKAEAAYSSSRAAAAAGNQIIHDDFDMDMAEMPLDEDGDHTVLDLAATAAAADMKEGDRHAQVNNALHPAEGLYASEAGIGVLSSDGAAAAAAFAAAARADSGDMDSALRDMEQARIVALTSAHSLLSLDVWPDVLGLQEVDSMVQPDGVVDSLLGALHEQCSDSVSHVVNLLAQLFALLRDIEPDRAEHYENSALLLDFAVRWQDKFDHLDQRQEQQQQQQQQSSFGEGPPTPATDWLQEFEMGDDVHDSAMNSATSSGAPPGLDYMDRAVLEQMRAVNWFMAGRVHLQQDKRNAAAINAFVNAMATGTELEGGPCPCAVYLWLAEALVDPDGTVDVSVLPQLSALLSRAMECSDPAVVEQASSAAALIAQLDANPVMPDLPPPIEWT